jgi:hypothetical protein
MKDHKKFQQQIILHANEPAQTGTQTLIHVDTHHRGSTTCAIQYKNGLYALHDTRANSLVVQKTKVLINR